MATYALNGGDQQVDIGDGYALSAPAVRGTVQAGAEDDGSRARSFTADRFDLQLESAGLVRARVIELAPTSIAAPPEPGARAFDDGEPAEAAVTLLVPGTFDESAVVLLEDESGALTWHLPQAAPEGTARGFGAAAPLPLTFVLPVTAVPAGARGFGRLAKKIIKVFRYPLDLLEEGVGRIAAGYIRRWEGKHRPYQVVTYGPADYRVTDHATCRLNAGDWERLGAGRALLFVHGTFSSCDAFHDLPPAVMEALSARYGGRMFAFDHPTLSDDPAANAEYLLAQLPAGTSLTVDIVCHSRGGLVAREIAARGTNRGIAVGNIVLVGVPNGGTALADKEHMLKMVDRLTTVARLFQNMVATVVVDALVAVVKCAAHALLEELDGLRAMNPTGDYVRTLNGGVAPAARLHAIIADFEPKPGTPLFSLTRAADVGADRIVFGGEANDLVVPTAGGYAVNAAGFPVPEERRFRFETGAGVIHTDYFAQPDTHRCLREWLAPTATRELAAVQARGMAPAELDALRPHLVNLSEGQLSRRGEMQTTKQDVDTLFERTLPDWLAQQPAGAPRRVVLWAHGGLINEQDGLAIAGKHVRWWKSNNVFPIYFVWETGLFDALGSLLGTVGRGSREMGARAFTDFSDYLVERGCRAARGDLIWGAMKTNAERASATGGGAHYVARKLAVFCTANPDVELHAVGHSAGSIFHAHFLTAARKERVPGFRTLQLLAPAIRVDLFTQRVMPLLDGYVDRLTMFSMTDDHERRDSCMGVYRKSLLYLIHRALERREGEPILGLRVSAENDAGVRRLFWGDDDAPPRADAVWSVTDSTSGIAASGSATHGGFDDDGPTMTSVALRILAPDGRPDASTLAALRPYAGDARRTRSWPLAEELRLGVESTVAPAPAASVAASPFAGNGSRASVAGAPAVTVSREAAGRRFALCVGIDSYPAPYTLSGCEGDAREWGRLLHGTLGFEVHYLINGDATRDRIAGTLGRVLDDARPGDAVVFQFSGHGTQLPDDSGDERDGMDEAFVPVDYEQARFLVDDDIRELLAAKLKDGVSLTAFIDCCHSGTITRVFGHAPPAAVPGMRARFMPLAPGSAIVRQYLHERSNAFAQGHSRALVERSGLAWVNFSACDASELAYEQGGNGDFTRRAIGILRQGLAGLTNAELQRRVVEAFGRDRRQTPRLDCPPEAEHMPLLHYAARGTSPMPATDHAAPGTVAPEDMYALDRRTAADRRGERRDDNPGRREADAAEHVARLHDAAAWITRELA